MSDLISVIIPVYNTGMVLMECIDSIEKNTYSNIEILIIDDGSTDETAKCCDNCAILYENVKVFHKANNGVSDARNYGLKKANGQYITFVDADDTIDKMLIEKLYYLCKKNNADISQCGYYECSNGSIKKKHSSDREGSISDSEVLKTFYLDIDISWNVWGKMYRKSCVKNIYFPVGKRVAEDMYFIYQVCKNANKIVFSKEALYYYNKNNLSAMADVNLLKFFDTYELIKKIWENEKSNLEQEKLSANVFFINNEIWFIRFMIARGAKGENLKRLREIRSEVISDTIPQAIDMLRNGRKLEYYLFRYCWFAFYVSAKLQTSKMKE